MLIICSLSQVNHYTSQTYHKSMSAGDDLDPYFLYVYVPLHRSVYLHLSCFGIIVSLKSLSIIVHGHLLFLAAISHAFSSTLAFTKIYTCLTISPSHITIQFPVVIALFAIVYNVAFQKHLAVPRSYEVILSRCVEERFT
jgi:hypothetical protein